MLFKVNAMGIFSQPQECTLEKIQFKVTFNCFDKT